MFEVQPAYTTRFLPRTLMRDTLQYFLASGISTYRKGDLRPPGHKLRYERHFVALGTNPGQICGLRSILGTG
jgi:hypothetical protein